MSITGRRLALTIVMTAAFSAGAAHAQNINEGRTPAQMFGAVCATCHASPRRLGRQMGAASLAGYLRQHYTTSREQAAALAGYLASFQPAAAQPPSGRRPAAEEGRAVQPPTPASPAARRRTPADQQREQRFEEHTAVPAPATARPPRAPDTRPPRTRPPSDTAAQQRTPAAPAPPPPQNGEPHPTSGATSAIPGSEPEQPTTRTDDIAD
jgi:hypothetical protein